MTIKHVLVGYDKTTEEFVVETVIPPAWLPDVKRLISLDPNEPIILDYDLTAQEAKEIARMAGESITGEEYDYFIQAFDNGDL